MRLFTGKHKCPNCGSKNIETEGSVVVGVPTLDEKEIIIYARCRTCKASVNVVCNKDRIVKSIIIPSVFLVAKSQNTTKN